MPRTDKGGYDWSAVPEGRYFIEWYERGKREKDGGTATEAQEAVRRKKHQLEGRALGIEGADEATTRQARQLSCMHCSPQPKSMADAIGDETV